MKTEISNRATHDPQDNELFFAHRYLCNVNDKSESIVLCAIVCVDHHTKTTTITYLDSYIRNTGAVPIDPINYPLSQKTFTTPFSVVSKYTGIPRIFFEGNVSSTWCKLARNTHVNAPVSSPRTPAQFLLEAVSDAGIWYFTQSWDLVRSAKKQLKVEVSTTKQMPKQKTTMKIVKRDI